MSNNIAKIRENQRKMKELNVKISNYRAESQKIPELRDVLVETSFDECFYGADDIAILMLDFVNANKDILKKEQQVKLQESAEYLKELETQKRERLNTQHNYISKIDKEILKLRDEILLLIKEDFKLENNTILTFKVPIRFIEDYKDIVVKYLDDNNISYRYTKSNKIHFLSKNEDDVDIRDLIQNEIRKVDSKFNFKSLAAKSNSYVAREEVIDLLYL